MRSSPFFSILLAAGVMLLHGVSSIPAQISESDEVTIGETGSATFPVRLSTTLDGVAGVQGVFRYESAGVDDLTLSISPHQPGSFILRSHEPTPGEVRFVAYSISHTINTAQPFLVCEVKSRDGGDGAEVTSVVIVEMTYIATIDGQPHAPSERYVNVPIRVEPDAPAEAHWILF